jgi:hypothetical protein
MRVVLAPPIAEANQRRRPLTPAPAAFEDPYTKERVLALVKCTGFIVG